MSDDIFQFAKNGTVQDIEKAVAQGASVTEKNDDGITPLHVAAANNPSTDVLEYLIAQGASVHAEDNNGFTPLHESMRNPNIDVIEYLISSGADVNVKSHDGVTPLQFSVRVNFNVDVLKCLMFHGARVKFD